MKKHFVVKEKNNYTLVQIIMPMPIICTAKKQHNIKI